MTEVKPPDAAPDPLLRQMRELERGMTIRTGELERENRRLRRIWMGTLIAVALLLGLATALVIVAARQGLPGTVASVVEARQFLLRDKERSDPRLLERRRRWIDALYHADPGEQGRPELLGPGRRRLGNNNSGQRRPFSSRARIAPGPDGEHAVRR